jgi:hypothetical protein
LVIWPTSGHVGTPRRAWIFTISLVCGIATLISAGAAAANQCVWTGSGGNGKNGRFSDSGNWSCTGGATPGTADDYFFDPTMTVNSKTGSNGDCTFDTNGGSKTVGSITIQGTYSSTVNGTSGSTVYTITNAFTMSAASATFAGGTGAVSAGSLSIGGGAFTGGTGTVSITGNLGITGGTYTGGTSTTVGGNASVAGALSLSAGTISVTGSVAVQSAGTLTLATGATLSVGTALTMDGTLAATGGTIQAVSSSSPYTFEVGSTATAAPHLNINGLAIKNTDSNGMWINAVSGSATTFTRFDEVAFSNGTGTALLNVSASSLYLSSNGCTFDGSTTYAIKLTSTAGSGMGPRLLFGNATCATNDSSGLCAASEKKDDDTGDGVPSPSTGGIVQFIRAAESDTGGTAIGFPTAGFDWSTFTYYSTYVAFHDASGGSDVVYVRDEAGNPLYSWTDPDAIAGTDETIVATPVWTTSGGTHYLYVAVNGTSGNTGGVYRLIDNGSKLSLDTAWPTTGSPKRTGYYKCTCTITSNVSLDATNAYWGGSNSSGQMIFAIAQGTGAPPSGWPVTAPATVTTSAPTLVTSTGMLYLGATSTLAQLTLSTLAWGQDVPSGIATINGRVSYGTGYFTGITRIYVGDSSGAVWAVDPSSFVSSSTITTYLWKYAAGSAVTDNYYDTVTDTVQFGTASGQVVVLTGAGSGSNGAVLNAGYPYTLPNSDAVSTAPLVVNGVLVVGSSKGNLYFLDRNTGSGVSLIKEVNFGSTEMVSSVAFDSTVSRYMVSTSSAANDGRVYYFDLLADPTPSSS